MRGGAHERNASASERNASAYASASERNASASVSLCCGLLCCACFAYRIQHATALPLNLLALRCTNGSVSMPEHQVKYVKTVKTPEMLAACTLELTLLLRVPYTVCVCVYLSLSLALSLTRSLFQSLLLSLFRSLSLSPSHTHTQHTCTNTH